MFPNEIILPAHVEETVIIEQWLRQKKGTKVTLTVPERGEKKQLAGDGLAERQARPGPDAGDGGRRA